MIQLTGEEHRSLIRTVEASVFGSHNGRRDGGVAQSIELRAVIVGVLIGHCSFLLVKPEPG